jgi:hypothetical protein
MYYNRIKENNKNKGEMKMIKFKCTDCGKIIKGNTEYDAEVAFDLHCENGCEKEPNIEGEIKYTSKKELVKFFETFRNKETKLLRVIAYFEDENKQTLINNIAEFDTIENEVSEGIFTKSGIRAWVNHLITDMFDCGCWIEVEKPDYNGHD